jgi:hypothetical protein
MSAVSILVSFTTDFRAYSFTESCSRSDGQSADASATSLSIEFHSPQTEMIHSTVHFALVQADFRSTSSKSLPMPEKTSKVSWWILPNRILYTVARTAWNVCKSFRGRQREKERKRDRRLNSVYSISLGWPWMIEEMTVWSDSIPHVEIVRTIRRSWIAVSKNGGGGMRDQLNDFLVFTMWKPNWARMTGMVKWDPT